MCDQQSLRSVCAYAQSDQSFFLSLKYTMSVTLLTKHNLEFLSLKGGCTGSSESTHVKIPHCWKSHVTAQIYDGELQVLPRMSERINNFQSVACMSHTDPSDLSIVGTCDICVTKSCDSIRLIGWYNAVINLRHHVSLKRFYELVMCKMFSKMLSVENIIIHIIILSLNTIILINS